MMLVEKLLNDFHELTDERKQQVIDFVEFLKGKQEKEFSVSSKTVSNELDSKYTFDSIVVGSHNQMAYQIANDFAKKNDNKLQLVYFYGEVGLGKTHLVQAIGNYLLENTPSSKVKYISLDDFINKFIDSIANGSSKEFRNSFLNYDVVIFDNFESLKKKIHTQIEFKHVLSLLINSGKQVIISSTKSPQEMIIDKVNFTSLIEIAAICEIKQPDVNTKVAIVKQKADYERIELSNEIITVIAQMENCNIRELINDTNRVILFIKMYGEVPSRECLEDILEG